MLRLHWSRNYLDCNLNKRNWFDNQVIGSTVVIRRTMQKCEQKNVKTEKEILHQLLQVAVLYKTMKVVYVLNNIGLLN